MEPTASTTTTVHRATFDQLSTRDLYALLRLRSEVFVVEQDCVFLDLDDRDHEPTAEHLWTVDDVGVTATVRLLDEGGGTWSIGRVVARADVRSRGVAAHLMRAALDRLRELEATTVHLGAQAQLREWYARFGFTQSGPRYLEDGILHVPMSLDLAESGS
jgi:ElaA protein